MCVCVFVMCLCLSVMCVGVMVALLECKCLSGVCVCVFLSWWYYWTKETVFLCCTLAQERGRVMDGKGRKREREVKREPGGKKEGDKRRGRRGEGGVWPEAPSP